MTQLPTGTLTTGICGAANRSLARNSLFFGPALSARWRYLCGVFFAVWGHVSVADLHT